MIKKKNIKTKSLNYLKTCTTEQLIKWWCLNKFMPIWKELYSQSWYLFLIKWCWHNTNLYKCSTFILTKTNSAQLVSEIEDSSLGLDLRTGRTLKEILLHLHIIFISYPKRNFSGASTNGKLTWIHVLKI